jgi:hypothetical protein
MLCVYNMCLQWASRIIVVGTKMLASQCVRCCVVLSVLAVSVRTSNYSCPSWFYFSNTTQRCECGAFQAGWVVCDQQSMTVQLNREFCATYSGQDGLFYIGHCPLNYKFNNTNRMFSELPTDPDLLQDMMCGSYNRKGLLCGQCVDGYGPGVYTLDSQCADCSEISTLSAVLLYLLVDIVPITLFFVCVVVFHLNITAGPLLGYVLYCQEFSVSLEFDPTVFNYIKSRLSPFLATGLQVMLITCEFWNINFLKPVIPPFCVSEKLTGLHIQVINSFSAVYPIILVILSLVIIQLHAKNNTVTKIILKPFIFILKKAKITAVTSDAVIRAFATFIFLSSIKNMFALYAIIRSTKVHTSIDGSVYKSVLYVDPTTEFFSPTHIIFLFIPLMQCIFLVFIPCVLLVVYPTRVYRWISGCVSARKRLAITAFVESLNSCFKDGLNGTRDYRALAGVLLFGLPLFSIWVLIIEFVIDNEYNMNILYCYISSFILLFVSFARPFKSTVANMAASYYFLLFGALANSVAYLWYNQLSISTLALEVAFSAIGLAAQVPVVIWVVYKFACYVLRKAFSNSSSIL